MFVFWPGNPLWEAVCHIGSYHFTLYQCIFDIAKPSLFYLEVLKTHLHTQVSYILPGFPIISVVWSLWRHACLFKYFYTQSDAAQSHTHKGTHRIFRFQLPCSHPHCPNQRHWRLVFRYIIANTSANPVISSWMTS